VKRENSHSFLKFSWSNSRKEVCFNREWRISKIFVSKRELFESKSSKSRRNVKKSLARNAYLLKLFIIINIAFSMNNRKIIT